MNTYFRHQRELLGCLTSRVLVCGEHTDVRNGPPGSYASSNRTRLAHVFGLGEALSTLRSMHFDMPKKNARKQALTLVTSGTWDLIVMLGRKTSAAFLHDRPFFTRALDSVIEQVHLVSLPSPSSAREWNAKLEDRARELLREAAPDLPWGAEHEPMTRLALSLRGAAEATIWRSAIPAALRRDQNWTSDDRMVALDAVESHGLSRTSGDRIAAIAREVTAATGGPS